jgi:type IV secretion/conjugal transfer VirB4 family ATPase
MITSIKRVRHEFTSAGAMHEVLAPCAFVGPNVVMTKQRDVFMVLRVEGVDPECMEDAEVARICERFDVALRVLGAGHRIYQYVSKRRLHGGLFSIELHLVILQECSGSTVRGLLKSFSTRAVLAVSMGDIRRDVEALMISVNSVCAQLQDTIRPRILDRGESLSFLQSLVTTGPVYPSTPSAFHVDQQMAQCGLEGFAAHLKQGDSFIKLLAMVEPPSSTLANMLRGLLSLPAELTICSEWKRVDNGTALREIEKRRDHYRGAITSLKVAFANALFKKSTESSDRRKEDEDDSVLGLIAELGDLLVAIRVDDQSLGQYSLTLALYGVDERGLQHVAAQAQEVFSTHGAKVVEERFNLLNAWFSMVPGNYARNFRQLWLLNTNYADMSFLFKPDSGNDWNEHLDRESLAVLETREATPYHLNLHVQDVGHTFVLGATGSGKSFLLNYLTHKYQKYSPHTFIFDLGGSYRSLTALHGGSYLHVGQQCEFTINPFSLAPSVANLDFLFAFVSVLIERDGYSMTVEERKDLHRAIGGLYQLAPRDRRLSTLATVCAPSYKGRLAEWVGAGRLAGYFDHAEDTLTLARCQTFDFEGMDRPEVLEPILFYVLHRATSSIQESAGPKLFVFDEAWRFFKNETTREYIREALKTWRKKNAVMILATQSSDDLMRSELLPVILESCATQLFLASPGMDQAGYREMFGLNTSESDLISRLTPKSEMLLRQGGRSKVLKLKVDPPSARIYGSKL